MTQGSLYTDEVRHYIRTRPWPKNLLMEVHEFDDPAPFLRLVFFRDNFSSFDGIDQKYIASQVNDLMVKIRKDGIPIYMEVAEGDGKA